MMTLETADVRLTQDSLLVDGLMVRDRTVVDYYAAMPADKRPGAAYDAMVVGSRALAAAGGSATMAALDDRLQSAVRSARESLETVPQTLASQIGVLCDRYFTENGELDVRLGTRLDAVGETLRADGPVVTQISDKLCAEIRRRVADALAPVSNALNVNDASGPLGLIQRTLEEVRTKQSETMALIEGSMRVQQQRDVSVHKGYDLEDFVESVMGSVAARLGDGFENCSHHAGIVPQSKKGDFVAVVDAGIAGGTRAAVTIEAKNRRGDSVNALCRDLKEAIENRDALVAIGVLTNPKPGPLPIGLYDRNKIVVHLPGFGTPEADPQQQALLLELAYHVGRLQAVAILKSSCDESLDAEFVAEHLKRLDATVRNFANVKRHLTGIETALAGSRESIFALQAEFAGLADELRSRIERRTAILAAVPSHALSA